MEGVQFDSVNLVSPLLGNKLMAELVDSKHCKVGNNGRAHNQNPLNADTKNEDCQRWYAPVHIHRDSADSQDQHVLAQPVEIQRHPVGCYPGVTLGWRVCPIVWSTARQRGDTRHLSVGGIRAPPSHSVRQKPPAFPPRPQSEAPRRSPLFGSTITPCPSPMASRFQRKG